MTVTALVRPALLAAALVLAAHVASAQQPAPASPVVNQDLKYSNKWRIEVKEGANNDGMLRFRVTPKGEAPIEVTVKLEKGRSENGCARDVRDAFKGALDSKRFHVEGDDFEDVLVKKKGGPDFALELLERTVKGTHVNLERE